MIEGKTALGLIIARGGSKGAPGKNIGPVGGEPLIAWTIEVGPASKSLDRLILSSDDQAIMAAARRHGCEVPFKREERLAADWTRAWMSRWMHWSGAPATIGWCCCNPPRRCADPRTLRQRLSARSIFKPRQIRKD